MSEMCLMGLKSRLSEGLFPSRGSREDRFLSLPASGGCWHSLAMTTSFFFWAAPLGLWDLSSPARDGTRTLGTGSMESQPLDHQGTPGHII